MAHHERMCFLAAMSWLLLVSGLGCGEDNGSGPLPTGVQGRITELDSRSSVADARLLLIDPSSLVPASSVVMTDTAGRYRIEEVLPGEYAVFIYHDSLVVFDRSGPRVQVVEHQMSTHDIRLINSELWNGQGVHIEGAVVDAVSGEPVAGAFVEPTIWAQQATDVHAPFQGTTLPEWVVTDSQGRFSMASYIVTDLEGTIIGLAPITVVHTGYRPFTLVGRGDALPMSGPALPVPVGSVLEVSIRLQPETMTPPAAVRGRVVERGSGLPVPGLLVGLSLSAVAEPDTFGIRSEPEGVPLQGKVDTTDDDGQFTIDGVYPGDYVIAVAYLTDDGYVGESLSEDVVGLTVDESDAGYVDIGDVPVLRALRPLFPAAGVTIDGPAPELRWEAFPPGEGYRLIGYELQVGTTYLLDPVGSTLLAEPQWQSPGYAPGSHVRWWVTAIAEVGEPPDTLAVGGFETASTFSVAP